MPAFALNRDTLEYTCGRLLEIEKQCSKSDQGISQQARNLHNDLQKVLGATAKTSYASVSPESIADIFSFTVSLLTDDHQPAIVSENLLILTYFVLREPTCIEKFDIRTLRVNVMPAERSAPPKNLSTCLAMIIWNLFTQPQTEFRKDPLLKLMIPLMENLCVANVGLSGLSYFQMCKILLGITTSPAHSAQAMSSFYRATFSLNRHLSNSRLDTSSEKGQSALSEEYIGTLSAYIGFLISLLEFFSEESPAKIMTTAGAQSGGFIRFVLGGASSDSAQGSGGTCASLETGFNALMTDVFCFPPDSILFHASAHDDLRRIVITGLYFLFFSSNYFYLDPRISSIATTTLLTTVSRRFIVAHVTQPIVMTIAFALIEIILRVYCFHVPARVVKGYFEGFIFKVMEEPDAPCGELKMAMLAHVGRLFSGDTLPNATVFKISELEQIAVKYGYSMYGIHDINDFEYLKLLYPRPFGYIFNLFTTFDCDFESPNLIVRLVAAVTGYTANSTSQDSKFYGQKYVAISSATHDSQSSLSSYQIPTLAYSFQLSVHKLFHQLTAEYLQRYEPSFAQSAANTSILASDSAMSAAGSSAAMAKEAASASDAAKGDKKKVVLRPSSEFVVNLIMYAHYLGVNIYDLSKSFNYVSPAICSLSTCVEAAIYALSRIAYSISYWAYLQQYDTIDKQKIPLNVTPSGTERAMARYAELFSYTNNVYDIMDMMAGHNKKRLFDRGYVLFDRKMKKGVDYFVAQGQIVPLETLETPSAVTLAEPVLDRRRNFDEEWHFNVYTMEVHRANYKNASEHYKSIAQFLLDKVTENTYVKIGITKDMIGEIIGSGEAANRCVLYEYVMLFSKRWSKLHPGKEGVPPVNAEGKLPVEEALRDILGQFKLPGEGQVIDRNMQYIAYAYTQADTAIIRHHKICHGLMFAIIMLNTDLHNSSIKTQRMTREMFCNNTKRIDTEGILTNELLFAIYDNIAVNPFSLGSINTKKKLFDLLDKHLKAPGGTKTLPNGTVIKGNATMPGTKDQTLSLIAFGHQYYPYLVTQCITEWLDISTPVGTPRKSTRLASTSSSTNHDADVATTYSPTMIAKLPEKYHFAFFESLLLKLDSSVPLELLAKLTQSTGVSEEVFLLCLRPFFMFLSLLHNSLLRQTRPICRAVLEELMRATGIASLSSLQLSQDSIASTTARELSTSYTTDSKAERTATASTDVSGTRNHSAYYNVIMLHTLLEFIYILADLGKTKPALPSPLNVQPYVQSSATVNLLPLAFSYHFDNKTTLLSTMYMGKLTCTDCWGLYLQVFACIEYLLDIADRNNFPRLERSEFFRVFNMDIPKAEPTLMTSLRKSTALTISSHTHRIDQDIQKIQRCIGTGDDGAEDGDLEDATAIYYICSLLDRRIISEIYLRFMVFTSEDLSTLMHGFSSCFFQELGAENRDRDRVITERAAYYFRRALHVLEGVAKGSLDRFKKVFREVQPMLLECYSCTSETVLAMCIGYYQPLVRMYFQRIKKRAMTSVQPSKVLDASQPKRSRSKFRGSKIPPKASAPPSTTTSTATSLASPDSDIHDDIFQHKLLEPLLQLVCRTTHVQLVDLVLNFLEELQLSYAVPGSLYMAIPAIDDLMYAIEVTVKRTMQQPQQRGMQPNHHAGLKAMAQSSELATPLEQIIPFTESIDTLSGTATQATPTSATETGSTQFSELRLDPVVPFPRESDSASERFSLLIERCNSISNRLFKLLDTQKAILPACAKMMYALSRQTIDANVASASMLVFTDLIYMAYDCMVHSYSKEDAEKHSLTYYPTASDADFLYNPYVETFTFTIRILVDLAHSPDEASKRIGAAMLREFVDKLMGNQLAGCADRRLSPEQILKEIIMGSIFTPLCSKLKSEPRLAPLSCSMTNMYLVVTHTAGSRMPILMSLKKMQQEKVIASSADTQCALVPICDVPSCAYHTLLDRILDYIMDRRMSPFLRDFIKQGLKCLVFETGNRSVLTLYKIISTYFCDMLSILLEVENGGGAGHVTDPSLRTEVALVHALGYSEHGQLLNVLTDIVNAVEEWLEDMRVLQSSPGALCSGDAEGLSNVSTKVSGGSEAQQSYLCVYDYMSHLTNLYARFYEGFSTKYTYLPALAHLRELILRLIRIIISVQSMELSGRRDESMLLIGLFTVGARMNGDATIEHIVLEKIIDILRDYAALLEQDGDAQGHKHDQIVTVVGSALTSLASMSKTQIESHRNTIFNLCLSLIISDSREVRMQISVAMKALFLQ